MKKDKIINKMLNLLSIVGVSCQFISSIPEFINNILLGLTLVCLIIFIFFNIDKKEVTRKKMIKKGKKVLSNISTKAILFGGDLSWTDDYIDTIKQLLDNNKRVEIFFPESKLTNATNATAKDHLMERIDKLAGAGAEIYKMKSDYYIRCIIADPDITFHHDKMNILLADRIRRDTSGQNRDKYRIEHIDLKNNQEICKMLIHTYNIIKESSDLI